MVSATTGGKKERVDQRYERIWRSFERYGKRFFGKPREKNTSTRTRKSQITCDMWKNEDIKEEEEEEDNKEAQILTNEEERDDERRFFLLLRAADGEKTSFSS